MVYTAEGGGKVEVPRDFLPFKELGLDGGAPPSHSDVKRAFKLNITKSSRQARALVSLAYYFHLTKSTSSGGCVTWNEDGTRLTIDRVDGNLLAAVGDTAALMKYMDESSSGGAPATTPSAAAPDDIYLAARSGFYDLCKALLERVRLFS